MVVTRSGFTQVVGNSFAGLGFAPEGPSVYEFPMEMFIPGSDLTPIKENIDKIIYGLTKWEPKTKKKGAVTPPKIKIKGKDYQEAVANMNLLFLKNMWSDGLPLLPATEERVNWILTGTDLSPDTVVGEGKILPRGGIATVETIAVSLAMAGGRPEYLPILIAIVKAITKPEWVLETVQTTTAGPYPLVVVNGPIGKQIRLNSGYGIMGPNPLYPADGPIGRALRLILQNPGGAVPGVGTMAIHGEMRYTNAVFAEDEEGIPEGWNPLSVDLGFARGQNVVTVMPADDIDFIFNADVGTKETLEACLRGFEARIAIPAYVSIMPLKNKDSPAGMVIIARGTAKGFASFGWSKQKVRNTLWEYCKIPWSEVERYLIPDPYPAARLTRDNLIKEGVVTKGEPWPISLTPEQILIVVAGGEQSGHASYVRRGGYSAVMVESAEIKLPAKAKWDALLKQAEKDLGPIPR